MLTGNNPFFSKKQRDSLKLNRQRAHMTTQSKDPVCGMNVDPEQTPFTFNFLGQHYFFCSEQCLKKFKKEPQKYIQVQPESKPVSIATEYTCPMHPQIIQDHPGNCPICGMSLEPKSFGTTQQDDSEYKNMHFRFWVGVAFSTFVLILAMSSMVPAVDRFISPNLSRWLQFILSTPVILWAGWPFFQRGYQSIINRSLNMFSLISLGVG
jgi:Cu+-exporting ATPase